MHPSIQSHRSELTALCRRYRVRRLEIFGSGAKHRPGEAIGDLDFLVEFEDRDSGDYADAYFGLLEALESLFGRPPSIPSRRRRSTIPTFSKTSLGAGPSFMERKSRAYLHDTGWRDTCGS